MIRASGISDRLRLSCDAVAARPRLHFWLPIAVLAGLVFPFYWLSAVPYVGGGNTGEFQTFGYLGGVAHAPTYPLLTGTIFVVAPRLAFLEPAHAANVVNGTYAALATVLLFILVRDITSSLVAAVTAAVVFATGFLIWELAIQAEAFSLQTALMLGMAVALRAFQRRPTPARFSGVAFATGLSLTNHGLSVFMLPLTLAYVLIRRPLPVPRPSEAAMSAGAFVLGLTPWIYLVRGVWTEVVLDRPETRTLLDFNDIWDRVISRTIAPGGVALAGHTVVGTPGVLEARWHAFTMDALREYGWFWIAASVAGAFFVAKRDWRLMVWMLGVFVSSCWFAVVYTAPDFDRYFSIPYAVLGFFGGVGVGLILTTIRASLSRFNLSHFVRPVVHAISIAILAGFGVFVGLRIMEDAGRTVNAHWEASKTFYMHAQSQVRHMVPNSVYMSTWPSSWPHQYVLHVERLGSDKNIEVRLAHVETMGIDQADDILRSGRSLYLQQSTPAYERDFAVVPEGAFFQVFLPATIQDGDLIKGEQDRVYFVEDGVRRWIPSLEIFDAHGFKWGQVGLHEERDILRLPEGPPLEMPQHPSASSTEPPCPPTCVPAN